MACARGLAFFSFWHFRSCFRCLVSNRYLFSIIVLYRVGGGVPYLENEPPHAARGAAEDARRAGQYGGSAASDMDISDAPDAPTAPSPGLSLDALTLGVARASGGTASDAGSGSARAASASQLQRRGRGRSLRSIPTPDGVSIVRCRHHGACSLVVGLSQGMPRASWACQSRGCR